MGGDEDRLDVGALSLEQLDNRYVSKELCLVKSVAVEKMETAIKETGTEVQDLKLEVKGSLTRIEGMFETAAKWQEDHNKSHEGGWKKSGILATIASTCITALAFMAAVVALFIALRA